MKFKSHFLLFGACIGLVLAGQAVFGENETFFPYQGGRLVKDVPQKGPIVLELFTSQSCSSCPPADILLQDLAKRQNVIALSCHVTYWNHLSWKDTLSREFCTERQNNYSRARGRQSRFTPELVVNGHTSMIGSKSYAIGDALDAFNGELYPVSVTEDQDGYVLHIPVSNKIKTDQISVQIVYFGAEATVSLGRGENSGLSVPYTNPVTQISTLPLHSIHDENSGIIAHLDRSDVPLEQKGFAVLVYAKAAPYGSILAAGQYLFPLSNMAAVSPN